MPSRALVVDDHLPGLALAEGVLEPLGAEVISATDGSKCIQAFAVQEFDVVFMDYRMPRMNGLQAIASIRRIEAELRRRRTPIIALTACAFPSEIESMFCGGGGGGGGGGGVDDVLLKPYRIEDLAAMYATRLRGRCPAG